MKYILALVITICSLVTAMGDTPRPISVYDKYNRYQGQFIPSINGSYNFYGRYNDYQYRIAPQPSQGFKSNAFNKGPVQKPSVSKRR